MEIGVHGRWRVGLLALLVSWSTAGRARAADDAIVFERDVRPILKAHCFHCHGEDKELKSGLDLRFVKTMIAGGDSGSAVEPGDAEASYFWMRVADDEMPPGDDKLPEDKKAILEAWINQGAKNDRPEPEHVPAPGMVLTNEEQEFWSFQPIQRPAVPVVSAHERVRNPIDAFLLKKLEAEELGFSAEADRETLIRRATFDLHGLPPTPEEIDAFLNDEAPDAYERLVDRLLESPRYGERWARRWLDVAGYADSDGYTAKDPVRPYAYKYRDYVIRALNDDRGWDRLIVEQIAGDELAGPIEGTPTSDQVELLTATGFLRMAPDGSTDGEVDVMLARNDVVAETIKIVSTSLLGLTVGCAQCHAHRYDPISHEDYFRFRAIFEPAMDPKTWRSPRDRQISLWTEADRAKAAAADAEVRSLETDRQKDIDALVARVLEQELEVAPKELRPKLREARDTKPAERSAEQTELLKAYPRVLVSSGNVSLYDGKAHSEIMNKYEKPLAEARAKRPPEDFLAVLNEVPGHVPTTFLFDRGDHNQPLQPIEPGELSVLSMAGGTPAIPVDDPALPTTGRRLAYARHLTSGANPLPARVFMNRVWMHHFGRGLVGTPADFGFLGERPTHPELLDWLADDFMKGGWTLKRMHRLIMTSSAYRQSSTRSQSLDEKDPENRWLGRVSIRRLEAEEVRDSILAASGQLRPDMYGTPLPVAVDLSGQVILGNEGRDGNGNPTAKRGALGPAENRRSLYVQVRRSMPLGTLEPFDAPMMTPNCDRRTASTAATQALLLMNNEFMLEQAAAMAMRVTKEAGDDPAGQVTRAWRITLGRTPTAAQVEEALRFLHQQSESLKAVDSSGDKPEAANDPTESAERRALASFCQALMSSNGFLYVD